MAERKTRGDWIAAALKALGDQGVEAVRVEPLAAAMGVTKGSFYWHFLDRDALLAAMLEVWRDEARAAFDNSEADTTGRLRFWLEWPQRYEASREIAVRDWSRRDARAATALAEIDALRVAAIETQFQELGFSSEEAGPRARLAYHALIGALALGAREPDDSAAIAALLTGRPAAERKAPARKREVESEMPDLFG